MITLLKRFFSRKSQRQPGGGHSDGRKPADPSAGSRSKAAALRTTELETLESRIMFSAAPVEAPITENAGEDLEATVDESGAAPVAESAARNTAAAVAETEAAHEGPAGSGQNQLEGASLANGNTKIPSEQEVTLVELDEESLAAAVVEGAAAANSLDHTAVQALWDEGIRRWAEAGLSDEQLDVLRSSTFEVFDLKGNVLGAAQETSVVIDDDGAGHGWFVDLTPGLDEEFSGGAAVSGLGASDHIDLLTTILHEQGHVLGLLDRPGDSGNLMKGRLGEGERIIPIAGQAEGAISGSVTKVSFMLAASAEPEVVVNLSQPNGAASPGAPSVNDTENDGTAGVSGEVDEEMIGEHIDFSITFDNTGDNEGYAPYIDFTAESGITFAQGIDPETGVISIDPSAASYLGDDIGAGIEALGKVVDLDVLVAELQGEADAWIQEQLADPEIAGHLAAIGETVPDSGRTYDFTQTFNSTAPNHPLNYLFNPDLHASYTTLVNLRDNAELTTATPVVGDVPNPDDTAGDGNPTTILGLQQYTFTTEALTTPEGATISGPLSKLWVRPNATIDVTNLHNEDLTRLFRTRVDHPLTAEELSAAGPRPGNLGDALASGLQHGDIYYTLQLPFGSFTPGQPAAIIDFEARLAPENGAEVFYNQEGANRADYELRVSSIGGFLLGNDPADNPTEDPLLVSTADSGTVVAQVVELVKNGPEIAVKPGPSFPAIYDLYVDIAAGETLEDILIQDFIPDSLVYVPNSIIVEYRNGSVAGTLRINQPGSDQAYVNIANPGAGETGGYSAGLIGSYVTLDNPNPSGGDLQIFLESFTAVDNIDGDGEYDSSLENDFNSTFPGTGTGGEFIRDDGDNPTVNHPRDEDRLRDRNWDIHIRYEAYAPEFQDDGTPNVAGVTEADNDAILTAVHNGNAVVDNDNFTNGHDDERLDSDYQDNVVGGIGTGKQVTNTFDSNGNVVSRGDDGLGVIPGDIIEYRLTMSMADFLAIDNLVMEDFLGDGLRYFENTSILVGGTPTEGITTFQSYIAIQSKGIGDDPVLLGNFDQSTGEVTEVVPFGSPEKFTNINWTGTEWEGTDSLGNVVSIGNIGNFTTAQDPDGGSDYLRWSLSQDIGGTRTGAFVTGDTDGDGTAESGLFGGIGGTFRTDSSGAPINITSLDPIDANGDGVNDGLDLDGDGEIDLYHYFAGGLFDPHNTDDNTVNNETGIGDHLDGNASNLTDPAGSGSGAGLLNADDPGGYHRFYDNFVVVNSATATLANAQDETYYDGVAADNGSFAGGSGYAVDDVITLSDGSTVTVTAVDGSGAATAFTVTSGGSTVADGDNLTSSGGTGTGFGLTLGSANTAGISTGTTRGDLQHDIPAVPKMTIIFYAQVEAAYKTETAAAGGGADLSVDLTDNLSNRNYFSGTRIESFEGDQFAPDGSANPDGIYDYLDPVTGKPVLTTPTNGQSASNYDGTGNNGSFAGGSGYSALEIITLPDGTTVRVDTVGVGGAVATFTVLSVSPSANPASLADDDGAGGNGFTLTFGSNNITATTTPTAVLPATHGDPTRASNEAIISLISASIDKAVVAVNNTSDDPADAVSIFNGDNLDPGENLDLFDRLGNPTPDGSIDDAQLRRGDTVTYRLTANLPYASGEDIVLRDFLPLPVFNLSEDYPGGMVQLAANFNGDANANLPNAYLGHDLHPDGSFIEWTYGPNHDVDFTRIFQSDGVTPVDTALEFDPTPDLVNQDNQAGTVYFDALNNSVIWNFGTWNEIDDADPNTRGAVIDILFTVKVNTEPFADGLFLTNQSEMLFDNTEQVTTAESGIIPVELLGPELNIRKGVLAVTPAGGSDGAALTGNGVGSSLSTSGANAEFAPWGHSEHNANPFNALDSNGTTTAEETVFGTALGEPVTSNGNFTRTTNQGAGEILAFLDNYGEAITFFENADGDIIQSDTGVVVGTVTNSATGAIQLDMGAITIVTPLSADYEFGVAGSVTGEALASATNGAVNGTLANTDIRPGTVNLTLGGDLSSDTFFDDGNGNLFSSNFVSAGTINYATGAITFNFDLEPQFYAADSSGNVVDGEFSGYLEKSNVVPGSAVITVNQYGTLHSFTTSGVTGTNLLGQELGNVLDSGGTDIGDINFTTGEVTLSASFTSPVEIDYLTPDGGTTAVTGEDNGVIANDFQATSGSLINDNITAGSVELTLDQSLLPDGSASGFPNKVLRDNPDPGTIPINGTLYIENVPGFWTAVGAINYVTGDYTFTVDTNVSQPPVLADYTYAAASAAATTHTATMTDGEMAAQTLAQPIIGGSVEVTVGTGNGAVTLTDDGNGNLLDSNNNVVGIVNYATRVVDVYGDPGDTVFGDRFDEVFQLTATYQINSGPGRINTDYLHGVTDVTASGQLGNWARFVDSNLVNADAGDVVTFGIFVENIGGGDAYDVVLTDAFFDGPINTDGFQSSEATFTDTDGNDVAGGYDLSSLNLRIATGDGVILGGSAEDINGNVVTLGGTAGDDFILIYTPGTVQTLANVTVSTGTTITLPAGNTFVPESLEISVAGTGATGQPYHVTISDFELKDTNGDPTGLGELRDHDLNVVGTIDYRTGVATFGTIPAAYDGLTTDSITYNDAALKQDELLQSRILNGNILTYLDHTNLVPNTVELVIDASGAGDLPTGTSITVRDDGAGHLYAVGALPTGFSAEGIGGVPATVTIDGTTYTVIGQINYAEGEVDIRLDVDWTLNAAFNGTAATGTVGTTFNGQGTNGGGELIGRSLQVRDQSVGATILLPGTVLVTVEDPLERLTPGTMETVTSQVFTDSGDGFLLNSDGVPVGSIDYVNGTVSFNATLRDSDQSHPVDYTVAFHTVGASSANASANSLSVEDGALTDGSGGDPGPLTIDSDVIVPGTVNLIDPTGVHGALTDDGAGNLINGNGVVVGTISYTTGAIGFTVLERLSLTSDYATANVFRIEFNDLIDSDGDGSDDRLGILQAGRDETTAGDGLPTNESGSNVLVVTYDVQLSDDWQPDEELTNQTALETYASTEGGENLIAGERETDIATVEGRDVEVEKFLMATNHESTGVFSAFDEDAGFFGIVESTLGTPETVTLDNQNVVPGSVQITFDGVQDYFNNADQYVDVDRAFNLVDDGQGNLVNSVLHVSHGAVWLRNYQSSDRGLPPHTSSVWGGLDGHANIIPGTFSFDRRDRIDDFINGVERQVTTIEEITVDQATGAVVSGATSADIQTTEGLLVKRVDREFYGIPFGGHGFLSGQEAGTVTNLLVAPADAEPEQEGYYDQSVSTFYMDSRLAPGSVTLEVNIGGVSSTLTDVPAFGSHEVIGDGDATTGFNTGTGALVDGGGNVVASINYTTGEVVFTQANAPLTSVIATYDSYYATINYETGTLDLNDDPNFISNNIFNPDGEFGDHHQAGDQNFTLATFRYDRLVGTIDYDAGTIDIVQDFNNHSHQLNGELEHYRALVDYQYSNQEATDQIPNPNNPVGTFDVAIGEEVVYGIVVTIPEGTTEELVITDHLPEGLELLDVQIVTTAAQSEGLLETDFALTGSFPSFNLIVGGTTIAQRNIQWGHPGNENADNDPTNFPNDHGVAAGPDAPYAILGGQDIQIQFVDGIVNVHDDPQDDSFDDATDPIDSAQNNSFVVKLITRVMNGLAYDETANQFDPAASGVADLDLANESVVITGETGTSLGQETGSPAGNFNGAFLSNTADTTYTTGRLDEDADGVVSLNSVTSSSDDLNVEIVEPDLNVEKVILGATEIGTLSGVTDGADYEANIGQQIAYQLTIGHTGSSTADAFNLNLRDLIMATDESSPTLEETFDLVSFTIQSRAAAGSGAAGDSFNGGNPLTLYTGGAFVDPTGSIGTNATYNLPELFSYDGSGNIVDFDFAAFQAGLDGDSDGDIGGNTPGGSTPHDLEAGGYTNNGEASFDLNFAQLRIGEELVITYTVNISNDTALTSNDGAGDADLNDIENVANLTWYSLPDTANDNITVGGSNPEVREYADSDAVALEIIGPDVDLALVKGVLAVTPASGDPQTFTQDGTPNNDGTLGGTFDDANFAATVDLAADDVTAGLDDLGLPGTITSAFLHPGMDDLDGNGDPAPNMAWNAAIDRDLLTGNGGVDAGDVVTYGIFIENQGTAAAFDITLTDVLNLINPSGDTSLGTLAAAGVTNVQVFRGDGTPVAHTLATYDIDGDVVTTPDDIGLRWVITDPDDNTLTGGVLEAGRVPAGSNPASEADSLTNTTGSNILVITYDMVIGTNFQPFDEVENTARVTEFTNGVGAVGTRENLALTADFPAILVDGARVEGRSVELEKHLVSTDLAHTGAVFDDLAVALTNGTDAVEGAEIDLTQLAEFPANGGVEAGSLSVTLDDGTSPPVTYTDIGTGALLESGLTTVVASAPAADPETITLGADDIVSGTLVLNTGTFTLDNGTVKDAGGNIVGSYANGAADQTVVTLPDGTFASVTSATYNREVADIDYTTGLITFTEPVNGDSISGLTTSEVDFTLGFHDSNAADVTPGEVVTYDIVVTVPEGTTDSLRIADQLPDGLEVLRLDVITTAAGSPNLDVDYGGGTPTILSVNGNLTLTGTSIDLTPGDTIQGTGDPLVPNAVVMDFGDVVNTPDVVQDAASTQNDSFVVRLTARVLNGLEYNPASNGSTTGDSGTADLNPASEVVATDGTALGDETGSPTGNFDQALLTNAATATFRDVTGTDQVLTSGQVNIDVVEPNLEMDKVLTSGTLVSPGGTATYEIRINHSDVSTGDAFNLVFEDALTLAGGRTSADAYMHSVVVTRDGTALTAGLDYTDSSNVGAPGTPGGANSIDLTGLDLGLGEELVISYSVTAVSGALSDDDIGTELFPGEDGDVLNTGTLTYYNIDDPANPENREYQLSDDAEFAVIDPDLDVNLVKSVLAIDSGASTFTADTNRDNDSTSGDHAFAETGSTITRTAGDFAADGFAIGDTITVTGTANNDGVYTIAGVTALEITVDEDLTDELVPVASTIAIGDGAVDDDWAATLANLGTTPITSFVLHNDTTTGDGIADLTVWNDGLDRDFTSANGGVDVGDVVTYGVFIENVASDEVFELRVNDTLSDLGTLGTIDPASIAVTLGDGTVVDAADYTVTFPAGGGFTIQLTNQSLAAGSTVNGGPVTNTTGDNVAIITYDVTVGGAIQTLEHHENTATVDFYTAFDDATTDFSADDPDGQLGDIAFVETRPAIAQIEKVITATSETHTGSDQHNQPGDALPSTTDVALINDDFEGGASLGSGQFNRIRTRHAIDPGEDGDWKEKGGGAWTLGGGTLQNLSPTNENGVAMVVDLTSITDISITELDVSFDYTLGDTSEQLFFHIWGVDDTTDGAGLITSNSFGGGGTANDAIAHLNRTNGSLPDFTWQTASADVLTTYNLFTGSGSVGGPAQAVTLTGTAGGSFSTTIDMSGYALNNITEYDYIMVGFSRNVAGASSAVTIDNVNLSYEALAAGGGGTSGTDDFVDAAIGETVTYELQVTLEEGSFTDLTVTDALPSGLSYVADSATITAAGNTGGITSGGDLLETLDLTVGGGVLTIDGSDLVFDFGSVVNPGTTLGATDTFTIEVQAFVTDSPANVDGATALNAATLTADLVPDDTDTSVVDIVVPELVIDKSVAQTTGDAGDTLDYTLTVSHDPASTADAFDLVIDDLLNDSRLDLVAGSVEVFRGLVNITGDVSVNVVEGNTAGDNTVEIDIDTLALGDTLIIKYQATLNNTVGPNETIANTATLDWDSNPLEPGDPGFTDERDTAVDGDTLSDDAEITTGAFIDVEKTIVTTSLSHTGADQHNPQGVAPSGNDLFNVQVINVEDNVTGVSAPSTVADWQAIWDEIDAGATVSSKLLDLSGATVVSGSSQTGSPATDAFDDDHATSWRSESNTVTTSIGAGGSLAAALILDSGGERVNIDVVNTKSLDAGTYSVPSVSFNADSGVGVGVIRPFLAIQTGTGPNTYETIWVGDAIDAAGGVETVNYTGETFTLASTETIYSGVYHNGVDRVFLANGVGSTDHDVSGITEPAAAGEPLVISHSGLGRTYAFGVEVQPVVAHWVHVDLGGTYRIDQVDIDWEPDAATDYTLYVYNGATPPDPDTDLASWTSVGTVSGRELGAGTVDFDEVWDFNAANVTLQNGGTGTESGLKLGGGTHLLLHGVPAASAPSPALPDVTSANQILWLDAADIDGAGNGTTGDPTTGSNVTNWVDKAGGDNDAIGVPGHTVTVSPDTLNGQPVIRFADDTDRLDLEASVQAQGSTAFLIYKQETGADAHWSNLLGGNLHTTGPGETKRLTIGGGFINVGSGQSSQDWSIQTMQLEAGDYRLWIDGTAYGPHTTAATGFTDFTRVGNLNTLATHPDYVDVAEVIVYDGVLTDTEREAVEAYLTAKWFTPTAGGAGIMEINEIDVYGTELTAGFNVVNHTTDTESVFDYAGDTADYSTDNAVGTINSDGPGGGDGPFAPTGSDGDNFSVRAQTYVRFDTAGTYTIAMGSADGRQLSLTQAFPGSAPGYSGFTATGGNITSSGSTFIEGGNDLAATPAANFGPGATLDLSTFTGVDGGGPRLNVAELNATLLTAGTYQVDNFDYKATVGGNIVPFLVVLTGTDTYETIWVGDPVAPTATTPQTESYTAGAETFTLAADTVVYAGFHHDGNSKVNHEGGAGPTDHDNNAPTLPTSVGQELPAGNGWSTPNWTRGYAFNIDVSAASGPAHDHSVATFTVAAGDVLALDAYYFEASGADSGEISIASGTFGDWTNITDFQLLSSALPEISISSDPAPFLTTGLDDFVDLTPGETVTYELTVSLEEANWDDVVVTDLLPDGLEFVSAGISANIAGMTYDNGTSSGSLTDLASLVGGGADGVLTISGSELTFNFGDIANTLNLADNAAGDDTDSFVITVTALVTDDAVNIVNGATAVNTATVTTGEGTDPVTDNAIIDIVEPLLDIQKSVVGDTQVSPGTPFTYRLDITHDGSSSADAFDVVIEDLLNDVDGTGPIDRIDLAGNVNVTVFNGSGVDVTATYPPTVVTGNGGMDTTMRITLDELPLGYSIVVTFDAVVNGTAGPLEFVPNTATLDWDNLSGEGDPNERDGADSDDALVEVLGVNVELAWPDPTTTDDLEDCELFLPVLIVDGTLAGPQTLTITVGGTATPGDDYTGTDFTSISGNTLTVIIPAGSYDGTTATAIPLLDLIDDSLVEADETITLTLDGPSGLIEIGDADGDGNDLTTLTYTINDNDSRPAGITTDVQLEGTTLVIEDVDTDDFRIANGFDSTVDEADSFDNLVIRLDGTDLVVTDTGGLVLGSDIEGAERTSISEFRIDTTLIPVTDIVVRTGVNDDNITIGDLGTLTGSLVVNGHNAADPHTDDYDVINYESDFNGLGADLDAETIIFGDGTSLTTGTGGVDVDARRNIVVDSGSTITSNGGSIDLSAHETAEFVTGYTGAGAGGSTTTRSGNFIAVALQDATVATTGTGATISVSGQGGGVGNFNHGIQSVGTDFTTEDGDISFDGLADTATGLFNRGITFGSNSTVVAGGDGDLVMNGTGSGAGTFFNDGIFSVSSTFSVVEGDVVMNGTGGGSGTAGVLNNGFRLGNSTISRTGATDGTITLTGTGGGGGNSNGVFLAGTDVNTSGGTGQGDVIISGTGGTGLHNARGLVIEGGSITTGGDGNIDLDGTGVGTATGVANRGVEISGRHTMEADGSGTITIDGTGGLGTNFAEGVAATWSSITVNEGDMTINGTATGTNALNVGVRTKGLSLFSNGSGNITVEGTGSGAMLGYGINFVLGTIDATGGTGDISLTGQGSLSGTGIYNTGFKAVSTSILGTGAIGITGLGGTGTTLNKGISIQSATVSTTGILTMLGRAHADTTGVFNHGIYILGATVNGGLGSSIMGTGGGLTSGLGNLNHGVSMSAITSTTLTSGSVVGKAGFGLFSKDETGTFF